MKSVILFRHGKSDWGANYGHDLDRPLSKRGIRDAKKIGKFLSKKREVPDLVISSTALRARNTIELTVESGGWSARIKYEKSILSIIFDGRGFGTIIFLVVAPHPLLGHKHTQVGYQDVDFSLDQPLNLSPPRKGSRCASLCDDPCRNGGGSP